MKKRIFDLDQAFADVIVDLDSNTTFSPLERHANVEIAFKYFIALDEIIDKSKTDKLCMLLSDRIPVPKHFLPAISFLLSRHVKTNLKSSRPIKFSRAERLSIYMDMCEEVYVKKKSKNSVFNELSLMTGDNGEVSEKTFSRIWDEFSKDESIPKFYQT